MKAAIAAQIEQARTGAHELGFKAGWDDAMRAEAQEKARIGAELERALEEARFTFFEARAQVLNAIEPLFAAVIEKMFPTMVQASVATALTAELVSVGEKLTELPLQISVSEADHDAISALIKQEISQQVELSVKPDLTSGQAYLECGDVEQKFDFSQIADVFETFAASVFATDKAFDEQGEKHG